MSLKKQLNSAKREGSGLISSGVSLGSGVARSSPHSGLLSELLVTAPHRHYYDRYLGDLESMHAPMDVR